MLHGTPTANTPVIVSRYADPKYSRKSAPFRWMMKCAPADAAVSPSDQNPSVPLIVDGVNVNPTVIGPAVWVLVLLR